MSSTPAKNNLRSSTTATGDSPILTVNNSNDSHVNDNNDENNVVTPITKQRRSAMTPSSIQTPASLLLMDYQSPVDSSPISSLHRDDLSSMTPSPTVDSPSNNNNNNISSNSTNTDNSTPSSAATTKSSSGGSGNPHSGTERVRRATINEDANETHPHSTAAATNNNNNNSNNNNNNDNNNGRGSRGTSSSVTAAARKSVRLSSSNSASPSTILSVLEQLQKQEQHQMKQQQQVLSFDAAQYATLLHSDSITSDDMFRDAMNTMFPTRATASASSNIVSSPTVMTNDDGNSNHTNNKNSNSSLTMLLNQQEEQTTHFPFSLTRRNITRPVKMKPSVSSQNASSSTSAPLSQSVLNHGTSGIGAVSVNNNGASTSSASSDSSSKTQRISASVPVHSISLGSLPTRIKVGNVNNSSSSNNNSNGHQVRQDKDNAESLRMSASSSSLMMHSALSPMGGNEYDNAVEDSNDTADHKGTGGDEFDMRGDNTPDSEIESTSQIAKRRFKREKESSVTPAVLSCLDFYEKSVTDLPNHVKLSMASVFDDFVSFDPIDNSPGLVEPLVSHDNLADMDYEVDSLSYLSGDEKKKRVPVTAAERMRKLDLDPMVIGTDKCEDSIRAEYMSEDRSDFLFQSILSTTSDAPITSETPIQTVDKDQADVLLQDTKKFHAVPDVETVLFVPSSIHFRFNERCAVPLEDIYCSITIYDVASEDSFVQVAEEFSFQFTKRSSSLNRALFVTGPVTDTMIVLIKLARQYRGDYNDLFNDVYLAGDKVREKDVTSAKAKARVFDSVHGLYSYFSWTAVNLSSAISYSSPTTVLSGFYLLPSTGNVSNQKILSNYSSGTINAKSFQADIEFGFTRWMKPNKSQFNQDNEILVETDWGKLPATLVKSYHNHLSGVLDIENVCIVQPTFANIRNSMSKKSRNIIVSVSLCERDTNIHQPGMRVFYPSFKSLGQHDLNMETFTFVSPSNDSPEFSEQIKFKLPVNIGPDHHLLFRFYHIAKNGAKEFIGYSFLRLFNTHSWKLAHGAYDLPFFKLKKRQSEGLLYLSQAEGKSESSSFRVQVHARSVAFPNGSQGCLQNFFNYLNRRLTQGDFLTVLDEAVSGLSHVPQNLDAYAPLILNSLFKVIEDNSRFDVRSRAFRAIMDYVSKSLNHNPQLIRSYVKFNFQFTNICEALLVPIQSFVEEVSADANRTILNYSWFIFSVLFKALLLEIVSSDNFTFSTIFVDTLEDIIVQSYGDYIKRNSDGKIAKVCAVIGNFLVRLMSIVNYSLVPRILQIALRFYSVLASSLEQINDHTLEAQLAFFNQMFSFRNYELLFLPQTTAEAMKRTHDPHLLYENISLNTYHHFLYTPFADLIARCLDHSSKSIRVRAIAFFTDFVKRTNNDERFFSPQFRQRINQIHFEFVIKFMDVVSDWIKHVDESIAGVSKELFKWKRQLEIVQGTIYIDSTALQSAERQKNTSMIATYTQHIQTLEREQITILQLIAKGKRIMAMERLHMKQEKRLLLSSVLHIIRNMHQDLVCSWCLDLIVRGKGNSLLSFLQIAMVVFEYNGQKDLSPTYNVVHEKIQQKRKNSMRARSTSSASEDNTQLDTTLKSSPNSSNARASKLVPTPILKRLSGHSSVSAKPRSANVLSFIKEKAIGRGDSDEKLPQTKSSENDASPLPSPKNKGLEQSELKDKYILDKILLEKHISYDANLYCLFIMTRLVKFVKGVKSKTLSTHFTLGLMKVLTSQLHLNQSDNTVALLLSYLRSIAAEESHIVCNVNSSIGPMLAEAFMCLCNSVIESVRNHASSSLYILLRSAYEQQGNIYWSKVTSIISLNHTLKRTYKELHLVNSIRGLVTLAQTDTDLPNCLTNRHENFIKDVTSLSEQLQKLVKDILAVNQVLTGNDQQRSEELLFDISKAFEDNPELHIMWLMQLANYHKKMDQDAESAQCYYRILAIMFESLRREEETAKKLPLDNLYLLCPHLRPSQTSIDAVVQAIKFTERDLLSLVKKTINALDRAELYEHTVPLLQILVAKFDCERDLVNLSEAHNSIANMLEKAFSCNSFNSRAFGTYWRLEFIGEQWGEMSGRKYVYKTPKHYKVHTMASKLKQIFGEFTLTSNPAQSDQALTSTEKLLVITNVKPYTKELEGKKHFGDYFNVNQFYSESAFTPNSKKISEKASEIYKRKIIITTRETFPDVRTRLMIVREEERILTPIETAIENINAQIEKLEEVIEPKFPDVAQLQLILQGSVRAGVNGGPKDIVESFLSEEERQKFEQVHVKKLEAKCLQFLQLCEKAIKIDAKLVKTNQQTMHIELEKGFVDTKNLFAQYLNVGNSKSPKPETSTDNSWPSEENSHSKSSANKKKNVENILESDEFELSRDADDYPDMSLLLPNGLPFNRYYLLQNKLRPEDSIISPVNPFSSSPSTSQSHAMFP